MRSSQRTQCTRRTQRRQRVSVACTFAIALALPLAGQAHAEDLFEVQVFHSRIAPAQKLMLELHSNYVTASAPSVTPPEQPSGGVLFQQIEPSYGIAPHTEVAVHFKHAIDAHGVTWGGVVVRGMTLLRDAQDSPVKIGINVEGGYTAARFDPARWIAELRPVIEWEDGLRDIDLNPVVAFRFTGADRGIPMFQPSVSTRVIIAQVVAPGVEYYADFGPVSDFLPLAQQHHYGFVTADILASRRWPIHFGAGAGLTPASSRAIITILVGHEF